MTQMHIWSHSQEKLCDHCESDKMGGLSSCQWSCYFRSDEVLKVLLLFISAYVQRAGRSSSFRNLSRHLSFSITTTLNFKCLHCLHSECFIGVFHVALLDTYYLLLHLLSSIHCFEPPNYPSTVICLAIIINSLMMPW